MTRDRKSVSVAFSRTAGVMEMTAIGLSSALGIGVFVLGPRLDYLAGPGATLVYGIAILLFVPFVLSYAEHASALSGSASFYMLARSSGSRTTTFVVAWLTLGGLSSAGALLALGAATSARAFVQLVLHLELNQHHLIVAVTVIAALVRLAGVSGWSRRRAAFVLLASTALIATLVWSGARIQPAPIPGESHPLRNWLGMVGLLFAALWSFDILLARTPEMRRPYRTAPLSLFLLVALAGVVGICAVPVWSQASAGLDVVAASTRVDFVGAILLLGSVFCWLGLNRIFSRIQHLGGNLARDGFAPEQLRSRTARLATLLRVVLTATAVSTAGGLVPTEQLASFAAATWLAATVAITLPRVRTAGSDRLVPRFKLPGHPLIPTLTALISLYVITTLPHLGLLGVVAWAFAGTGYYWTYGRKGSVAAQHRTHLLGDPAAIEKSDRFRALLYLADDGEMERLLPLARALIPADGELLTLTVVALEHHHSPREIRELAVDMWERVNAGIETTESDVSMTQPLVRVAPDELSGIRATMSELGIDLLLFPWSSQEDPLEDDSDHTVLAKTFETTACPMVLLRLGTLRAAPRSLQVATAGGPHSTVALALAERLGTAYDAPVELLHIHKSTLPKERAEQAIARTLEADGGPRNLEPRIVESDDVVEGLLRESRATDVLLLGASEDRLLDHSVLEGLPVRAAEARRKATLVVKAAEPPAQFWARRLWRLVANTLPRVTLPQRIQVFNHMRRAARGNVDFYILTLLASAIATMGLRLNSGAVIIGAMLVAPLMSPILAVAQGIVQGHIHMIRRGASSTLRGAAIAICVGAVVALALSDDLPTNEMLARGRPNLLDLLVAVAAGAAAAYSVSRESLSAALPGVAISVALVPPLCVTGLSLGASDFRLAGGAFLLFVTNLAAIISVGATTFLLLGFRPTLEARERRVLRGLQMAVLGVALLAIPLGLTTCDQSRRARLATEMSLLLDQSAAECRIDELDIRRSGDGYLIRVTIWVYGDLEDIDLGAIRDDLELRVGVPIVLQASLVPAKLVELER